MGARNYGISLRVLTSIAQSERSERVRCRVKHEKKISYLQAIMYHFVNYVNTIALYCQEKSTLFRKTFYGNPCITLQLQRCSKWEVRADTPDWSQLCMCKRWRPRRKLGKVILADVFEAGEKEETKMKVFYFYIAVSEKSYRATKDTSGQKSFLKEKVKTKWYKFNRGWKRCFLWYSG